MATKRLQREGVLPDDIDDPLVAALSRDRDKCCDEVGYEKDADISNPLRPRCPVRDKCRRVWLTVENSTDHNLSWLEYRRLSQKFFALRQERDRLLGLCSCPDKSA